jgi:hypothetical protein
VKNRFQAFAFKCNLYRYTSGLYDGSDGKKKEKAKRLPKKLVHPGETVYNLPPLNHGPVTNFAPTCSAYANRLFIECLTPSKRFVATPNTKHRPLSDYPDPRMRWGCTS